MNKPDYVSPCDGGCWFCNKKDDRPMFFTTEFDAYFHEICLKSELNITPFINPEAQIIGKEFKDVLEL